ncbi:MAG: DUF4292 domain-containing protein [Bacteroidales bacterium]|nr:DUF4292 domain-containing protein [Bacteroidales bacterium]MDZ4205349.1 DUF4292 domain-containing protein [Bacteroidales bacterium]
MNIRNFCTVVFNTQYTVLFSVFVILLISSCSLQRKAIKEPLIEFGTEYLVSEMRANEISNQYFTARFSAEITQGKSSITFQGQLRIKKDSIIWVTVSPALGIEMGRLVLTNDSVKWINRLDASYLLASVTRLSAMLHPALSYDMVQAFLLGNDLSLYDDTQFKSAIDHDEYRMTVTNRRRRKMKKAGEDINSLPIQYIWLNPKTFRITRVQIEGNSDKAPKIEAFYSNFVLVGQQQFASKQSYFIKNDGKKTEIFLNLSRINIQPVTGFPFTVPERYIHSNNF